MLLPITSGAVHETDVLTGESVFRVPGNPGIGNGGRDPSV